MYYKENRDKKLDLATEIWDCKGQRGDLKGWISAQTAGMYY